MSIPAAAKAAWSLYVPGSAKALTRQRDSIQRGGTFYVRARIQQVHGPEDGTFVIESKDKDWVPLNPRVLEQIWCVLCLAPSTVQSVPVAGRSLFSQILAQGGAMEVDGYVRQGFSAKGDLTLWLNAEAIRLDHAIPKTKVSGVLDALEVLR